VGTPENRRVEIFLVPMPTLQAEPTSASTPTAPTTTDPKPTFDEPMK
jgi:hypothetical protein